MELSLSFLHTRTQAYKKFLSLLSQTRGMRPNKRNHCATINLKLSTQKVVWEFKDKIFSPQFKIDWSINLHFLSLALYLYIVLLIDCYGGECQRRWWVCQEFSARTKRLHQNKRLCRSSNFSLWLNRPFLEANAQSYVDFKTRKTRARIQSGKR